MPLDNMDGETFEENATWESTARWADYSVFFPKTPNLELILMGAVLYQDMDSHDVLELTFKGKPFKPETAIYSEDPVRFKYISGPEKSVFEGYVYSVDTISNIQSHVTRVICVSASYYLKDSGQNIFKKVTADQVIAKICEKHGMAAVTQRHPRVRESIVQAGQTDWQLLQSLANQTGFALRAENTTIFFLSKNKIYDTKKPNAPYFKYSDGLSKAQRTMGTCLSFKPMVSDSSTDIGSRVSRVINGINYTSGKVVTTEHGLKDFTVPSRGVVVPSEDYFNEV